MNFQETLIESARCLDIEREAGFLRNFALIGALALARVSVPRATADIDYAIQLGEKSLDELARKLKGTARHGDVSDPLLGCVSLSLESRNTGVPVQLVLFPKSLEEIIFADFEEIELEGKAIPFASARALLLMKLYAGGPLDLEDARQLIFQQDFNTDQMADIKKMSSRLRLNARLNKVMT